MNLLYLVLYLYIQYIYLWHGLPVWFKMNLILTVSNLCEYMASAAGFTSIDAFSHMPW